ncbi:MAG: peptidoglycan DD-metalloendopeptidase family protein [Fusobacteria bacterium]|nr:peptidoglycan DD-metalloendopeptidase family protein [Fusobacteriota bacterium]
MKKKLYIVFFILGTFFTYSNNIENMQEEVKKIEKGIEEKKQQIAEVSREQKKYYDDLRKLDKEVKTLENDRNKIENKLKTLNRNIDYGESTLIMATEEMNCKNTEIKSKILLWYKYGSKGRVEYISVGDTYLDVIEREENLKKMLEHDKKNIYGLVNTKNRIEEEKEKILNNKQEVELLKADLILKKKELDSKQKERNIILKKLGNQKSFYEKEVKKLNSQKQEIEKKIQQIILAETKAVRDMSLEEIISEIDYMVYPIDGIIAVRFGDWKQGKIKSSAIEIKSELGSRVVAASKGRVIYSGKFQNLGKVIIIDHGYNLVTVYGNMIHSIVKVGEIVERGQNIGVLGMSTNERDARLYFELRSKAMPINPLLYLKK